MSDSPPASKRQKLQHGSTATDEASITSSMLLLSLLPDDVLDKCFSFVGKGHYRYVAGTCHRFRDVYANGKDRDKTTTWESAAGSMPCAELCLEDHNHIQPTPGERKEVISMIALKASEMGKPELLDWACRHVTFQDISRPPLFQAAAQHGHINILEWAEINNHEWHFSVVADSAAMYGQIPVLEWISLKRGEQYLRHCMSSAAAGGCIDVLDWLKGCGLIPEGFCDCWLTMHIAACHGHVHVLDWFHENGYHQPPHYNVLVSTGAENGHINFLQWTQSHGMAFTSWTSAQAARCGHLEVLQWLRENGCPWDGKVIYYAREGGHHAVVEWALDNGCPIQID